MRSGIIASIIRTVVFSRIAFVDVTCKYSFIIHSNTFLHTSNHQPDKHTEVVNWTLIEPGMYLLAACALSFKPLFHLVAKALHLSALVTHTRSYVWKENATKASKTTTSQDDIYLNTLKSSNSDGFMKLHSGPDSTDEEAEVGIKNQTGIKVVVTWSADKDEESQTMNNERHNVSND